jgi:hypothetical protein
LSKHQRHWFYCVFTCASHPYIRTSARSV